MKPFILCDFISIFTFTLISNFTFLLYYYCDAKKKIILIYAMPKKYWYIL